MPKITDAKILILATDGFEQSELQVPQTHLAKRGAMVHVATPDGNAIRGWNEKDWGEEVEADLKLADVNVSDYDALVLPGGQINPDLLRVNKDAVALIRDFCTAGKTIAAICHAPWLLIEAGIVDGREMTSYNSIRTDLENAGAKWRDEAVVTDNAIITSRSPEDLTAFVDKIVEEVEEGRHQRAA
ncbi:type 1 glutamine amidotransferase domain-containing protein [Poseidonocella sedimentorum]|uniref:Protease I n=1 Tax=Poseidonocella sedimentorum TaxID=871652 RepID=A0A1I6DGY3_9RHOB|nr:type 1 glutamine amidotransferase domain-containing protein [Poseidonocella sedimentorum]SFR04693.1 protease I [Poseidonocella sedimentorum]